MQIDITTSFVETKRNVVYEERTLEIGHEPFYAHSAVMATVHICLRILMGE